MPGQTHERRSLRMFDAIPPYLGGKRKLLALIFQEIAKHLDPSRWQHGKFVDGFMGGGSVALYAKAQFRAVVANDISDRSAIIAKAVICNNSTTLTEEDCLRLLAGEDSPTNYAQASASEWFHPLTAQFIDRALAFIETVRDDTKREMLRLVTWRVAMNARPSAGGFTSRNVLDRAMAGELKVSGMAGAVFSFRPPDLRDVWRFAQATNRGVFYGNAHFTQADAVEEAPGWDADVIYLDPPYAGAQSYERFYKIADCVMAQRDVTKERTPSAFSVRHEGERVAKAVIDAVASTNTPLVVWSFSDVAISRAQQLDWFSEAFRAYEVPVQYRHTNAQARGKDGDKSGAQEVLIVAHR